METRAAFAFVDIGPARTTVAASTAAESQQWVVETPTPVRAAATNAPALLIDEDCGGGLGSFLRLLCTAAHIATADHVFLLTRHDCAVDMFYTYVARWLRAACPSTTAVSLMPLPLYAARLSSVETALVIESNGGLVTCTPVIEGIVATELSAHWGDVCTDAPKSLRTLSECWVHFARSLLEAVSCAAAVTGDGGEKLVAPRAATSGMGRSGIELMGAEEIPFLAAVTEHLQLCRRRELSACLSTIVLYDDAATLVDARYAVGLLLSLFLPDSLVTWC